MAYSIKDIPRDDYAVQALRTENTRPAVAPETKQTPEYPPIHTDDKVNRIPPKRERRHASDRRSGQDRRGGINDVLHDTRSGRERRRIASNRRGEEPQPEKITHKMGVDIEV